MKLAAEYRQRILLSLKHTVLFPCFLLRLKAQVLILQAKYYYSNLQEKSSAERYSRYSLPSLTKAWFYYAQLALILQYLFVACIKEQIQQ